MTKQGKRVPTYTAVALTPSGEWQTELPDDATDVVAVVRARTGRGLTEQIISASELAAAAANKISIEVAQPELQHYRKTLQSRLKGMALDAAGQPIAYLPIVVYAQEMQLPLFFTTTDSDGRFAIELTKEMPEQIVIATLDERNAIVLNLADIYANANKILLFKIANDGTGSKLAEKAADGEEINLPITDPNDCDCHNGISQFVPRVPNAFTFANSNQFSQDINACEPLTTANRSVEEFKFYKIARTSQPVVRKFAFGKAYNELKFVAGNSGEIVKNHLGEVLGHVPPTNTPLSDIKTAWDEVVRPDGSQVWGISKIGGGADWSNSEWDSAIDWTRGWDAGVWKATLHQATTFAHGRIFVMRQTITADGHSKGELVGSDTLTPGEKRQKAVLNWLRQEMASRSESVEQVDSLTANLSHNRDISEVVKGVVKENSSAHSGTSGGSDAFGMGMAGIGTGFGFAMGMSTSSNHQDSNAAQANDRSTSADSLQQLRDSTQQSANSVRAMRSLVVQNVQQSETSTAETFVLANHNRCHALSVFYHRVLAHYVVTQALTDLKECLFVPMQMRPFEMDTIVRYRDVLRRGFLLDKNDPLYSAFDAAFYQYVTGKPANGAILNTTSGQVVTADETVTAFTGRITLNFFLHVPSDAADLVSRQVDTHPVVTVNDTQYSFLEANWDKFNTILSPDLVINAQNWGSVTVLNGGIDTHGTVRKNQFERDVLPVLVRKIAATVRLSIKTDGTNYIPLPLELHASQSSGYKIGEPITFQWRATVGSFNLTTAQLKGAKVHFDSNPLTLPADAAVRLTSCFLEYKTATSSPTTLVSSALSIDLKPLTAVNAIEFESIPVAGGGSSAPPPMPLPRLVDALVEHFNLNLEYYHRVIWQAMDAQTRFNILEGMVYDCVPEMDMTATPPVPKKDPTGTYVLIKSYRTVAQVTENALVGIVGNSWVLPAAKGTTLDPTIRVQEGETLFSTIEEDVSVIKTRISLPTPGIYAETYLSACNACEPVQEDSSQDWSIFKTDEPTAINPLDTSSRYQNPGNLQPKDMQTPIINIQNAPAAPDPTGLGAMMNLLGTQGLFKDMTGLEGTQKIALEGMLGNQQAALGYAGMASKLAALGQTEKLMKLVQKSGLPQADQKELLQTILGKAATFLGMGDEQSGGFNVPDLINQARKTGQSPTRVVSNTAGGGYQQVDLTDNQLGALVKTIPQQINGVDNPEIAALRAQGYKMLMDGEGNVEVYAGTSGGSGNLPVNPSTNANCVDRGNYQTYIPYVDDRCPSQRPILGNPTTGQLSGIVLFRADTDFTGNFSSYVNAARNRIINTWQNQGWIVPITSMSIQICNPTQANGVLTNTLFNTMDTARVIDQVYIDILPSWLTPAIINGSTLINQITIITVGNGASNTGPNISHVSPKDNLKTGYFLQGRNAQEAAHEFGHLCGLADRYAEGVGVSTYQAVSSADQTNFFSTSDPDEMPYLGINGQNYNNMLGNRTSNYSRLRRTLPIILSNDTTYFYRTNLMSNDGGGLSGTISDQQLGIVFYNDADLMKREYWERTPFRLDLVLTASDRAKIDGIDFLYNPISGTNGTTIGVSFNKLELYYMDCPLDVNENAATDLVCTELWFKLNDGQPVCACDVGIGLGSVQFGVNTGALGAQRNSSNKLPVFSVMGHNDSLYVGNDNQYGDNVFRNVYAAQRTLNILNGAAAGLTDYSMRRAIKWFVWNGTSSDL